MSENSSSGSIRKVYFVFSRNCPHCEEVLNTELFKNISENVDYVFDELGFWIGADYANIQDIVDRRIGFGTPSVVIDPLLGDPFVFENRLSHYAYIYNLLGIRLKGRKRRVTASSEPRRKGKTHGRKRRAFIETKQIAKEVSKAVESLETCEEEGVCREM